SIVCFRISGLLFFGAPASIVSVPDGILDRHKVLIVDLAAVPFLDSAGANMIVGLAHKAHKRVVSLWLTGASRDIMRVLITHGLRKPLVHYASTIEDAVARVTAVTELGREPAEARS